MPELKESQSAQPEQDPRIAAIREAAAIEGSDEDIFGVEEEKSTEAETKSPDTTVDPWSNEEVKRMTRELQETRQRLAYLENLRQDAMTAPQLPLKPQKTILDVLQSSDPVDKEQRDAYMERLFGRGASPDDTLKATIELVRAASKEQVEQAMSTLAPRLNQLDGARMDAVVRQAVTAAKQAADEVLPVADRNHVNDATLAQMSQGLIARVPELRNDPDGLSKLLTTMVLGAKQLAEYQARQQRVPRVQGSGSTFQDMPGDYTDTQLREHANLWEQDPKEMRKVAERARNLRRSR